MKKTARLQRQEGVQKNRIDRESKILEKKCVFFLKRYQMHIFWSATSSVGKIKKQKYAKERLGVKKIDLKKLGAFLHMMLLHSVEFFFFAEEEKKETNYENKFLGCSRG